MPLAALAGEWCSWLAGERRLTDRTLDGYRRDLAGFLAFLAGQWGREAELRDLARLDRGLIDAHLTALAASGRAAASVARAASSLRSFFRFVEAAGLGSVPARGRFTAPAPVPPAARPGPAVVERAVAAASRLSDEPWLARRDAALFGLLFGAGLRLGEALALTREQAPCDGRMTVTGRGGRRREVIVPPPVAAAVAHYLAACPFHQSGEQRAGLDRDAPLFVGSRGRRLNPGVVQRQMRRLRGLLGLPAATTPAALRQGLMERLRSEGAELSAVQQALGYAHPVTARRAIRRPGSPP